MPIFTFSAYVINRLFFQLLFCLIKLKNHYPMKKYFIYLIISFICINCANPKTETLLKVYPDNENIMFEGRIGQNESKGASEIYWSGSSVKINFNGTSIKSNLEDEFGMNYFNTILDDSIFRIIHLSKDKKEYILADNLSSGNHSMEIVKRNEWTFGKTLFFGFEIVGKKILKPDLPKKLFLEFYGNSITEGHGNEDLSGEDKNTGDVANNYNTYAAMTARHFDAEYSCIARSGIGVTVSWFNMIMPEMYYRLDPSDANSQWDFEKQPDIVVVNLFQNDKWIHNLPDHPEFIRRFGDSKPTREDIEKAYVHFIKSLREKYPNTHIICMLGSMDITSEDSVWPDLVSDAVDLLEDNKVSTCFTTFKNTGGHPTVKEHQLMANFLIETIETKAL